MATEEGFAERVEFILGARRHHRKLVVPCEGGPTLSREEGRGLSPRLMALCKKTPDATFLRGCVPDSWRGREPEFVNCGGRANVIKTYMALLDEHKAGAESFLDPSKLYAFVDLDLQPGALPSEYGWATTEGVHQALYGQSGYTLRFPVDSTHRIWVTALIHKEAFFLLPSMEPILQEEGAHLDGVPLDLEILYALAAERMGTGDEDLQRHFDVAVERLERVSFPFDLKLDSCTSLQESWLAALKESPQDREALMRALFLVTKAKPLWKMIEPPPGTDYGPRPEQFHDQLSMSIAAAIADMQPHEHPIAGFIDWLKQHR